MITTRMKICILAALTLFFALAGASWGRANERVTEFNIPPQSLDSALIAFSKQANVQISVAASSIAGIRTAGVVGSFTPSAALGRILSETGLGFSAIGDRTYAVALLRASARMSGGIAPEQKTLAQPNILQHQNESASPAPQVPSANAGPSAREEQDTLGELVVTGTHIRGERPVGANLIVIGREEIEQQGLATIPEVLRVLPQNFPGGVREETPRQGNNAAFSSAPNLRGLGPEATLVLVNGRRMPVGGTNGSFTDISGIPLAALERIEVLTDGASAIYGADAVGGVINLILRKNYSGAETRGRVGGVTDGDAKEYQAAQSVGGAWGALSGVFSYEYYEREALAKATREQTENSDLGPLGGSNWSLPFDNPGTIVTGPQTWAIPAGQDGTDLEPTDFVSGTQNLGNSNEGAGLLPEQKRHSAFGTLQYEITENFRVGIDALYSQREALFGGTGIIANLIVPNTNPFYVNPTGGTGPIIVRYKFLDDLGPANVDARVESKSVGLGLEFDIGGQWTLAMQGSHGQEDVDQKVANNVNNPALSLALADPNPATAFNPFGDGSFNNPQTLDAIRFQTSFETESTLTLGSLVASGRVGSLPGGPVRLALGGEYRKPSFDTLALPVPNVIQQTSFDREVTAGFAELLLPVVEHLELAVAGRYEDYSDFGSATTPKAGLNWRIAEGLALRGTWSRSFKAPLLADLDETTINRSLLFPTADPSQPSGFSSVLLVVGNNADLQEETAEAWTVGLDLFPGTLGSLGLHIGYFDIDYEDRVIRPNVGAFLVDPTLADLVDLTPTPEERQEICSRNQFIGNPSDCLNAPIAAIADTRLRNAAISRTRGIDFMGSYSAEVGGGTFGITLDAAYIFDLQQALGPLSPVQELVSTARRPMDFRGRANLSWTRDALTGALLVNYADNYRNISVTPMDEVDSWTTFDVTLRYAPRDVGSWLEGVSVILAGINVLDEAPPFLDNSEGVGYDQENADMQGRMISLTLMKEW